MMRSTHTALAIALCLGITGCGSGGSTNAPPVAVAPAPMPAPTPTPISTPTPTAVAYTPSQVPSALNATVGLHQANDFPVLSWFFRTDVASSIDGSSVMRIGYDFARTSTTITIPLATPGYLDALAASSGTNFTRSLLVPTGGIEVRLLRPGSQNTLLALDWTSVGYWEPSRLLALPAAPTTGVFAYGVAGGALSATGNARFALLGYATYDGISEGIFVSPFRGELDVDFAGRTVSGRFQPGEAAGFDPTVTQSNLTLLSTPLAADGTFSGVIRLADGSNSGTFEGRLAGPQNQEILIRFTAPIRQAVGGLLTLTHYGVFAGKR